MSLPRIITSGDTVSESSDDHFSSASEGTPSRARALSTDGSQSPIPITRVERVDDKAAYGEEPGTPAYALRTADAVPDEVEVVPEGRRPRSGTQSRSRSHSNLSIGSPRPETPGGSPIPQIKVERLDDKPAYGEVEGTLAKEMRESDAKPDEITISGDGSADEGRTQAAGDSQVDGDQQQAWFRDMWEGKAQEEPSHTQPADDKNPAAENTNDDDDDDFGDDFDEFAEEGGDDDDFGDFDEADADEPPAVADNAQQSAQQTIHTSLAGLPPLDLKLDLSPSDLSTYLDAIFPSSPPVSEELPPLDMSNSSPFLSDRSLSLWQQLVSPPPMQPPNWTRSRIRRLFLVSLGVPVDLDEILPPSKQKRLVLPNINLPVRDSATLERLKSSAANDSSTSVDSKTGTAKKKSTAEKRMTMRGPPPPPEFDANAAAMMCKTTQAKLEGFEDAELRGHLEVLEGLNSRCSKVLEYWLERKDEAVKEKEALEGVIENLVGFVKGRREGGRGGRGK